MLFIFVFCTLLTGGAIKIFRDYRVNYIYIFRINPENRKIQYSFYKMFLFLLSMFLIALNLEELNIKGYLNVFGLPDSEVSWPTIVLLCMYSMIIFNPFKFWYHTFRKELAVTLFNLMIAPFGSVRFKDFFVADILTSLVKPIEDLMFLTCYFQDKDKIAKKNWIH